MPPSFAVLMSLLMTSFNYHDSGGPFCLEKRALLVHITDTHPCFIPSAKVITLSPRMIIQWHLCYHERFLTGSGQPLCSHLLWKWSLISFFILQGYENMLKSLLLINSPDIAFRFLSNKQGTEIKQISWYCMCFCAIMPISVEKVSLAPAFRSILQSWWNSSFENSSPVCTLFFPALLLFVVVFPKAHNQPPAFTSLNTCSARRFTLNNRNVVFPGHQ